VPGVQNVIGTYYSTIFCDRALENCTKVNTKSEHKKRRVASQEFNSRIPKAVEHLWRMWRSSQESWPSRSKLRRIAPTAGGI